MADIILVDSYGESNKSDDLAFKDEVVIADSYGESNSDGWMYYLCSDKSIKVVQSFTGKAGTLIGCEFYLKKYGSPTGNMVAKLYAHSGTYGVDGLPTGVALATSNSIDVSTLTTSFQLIYFTFEDAYILEEGTKYCLSIEYSGGNWATACVDVGEDHSSPTHSGNVSGLWNDLQWYTSNVDDLIFYVYTDRGIITKTSHSFTGKSGYLTNCKFYLKKVGNPTGNITAKLYSHSGTYGTSSLPDALLATSNTVDIEDLSASYDLINFDFEGAEQYELIDGTKYCIELEYSDGDEDNYLVIGLDNTSPAHNGNSSYYIDSWIADSTIDLIFYVYAEEIIPYEEPSEVALSTLTLKKLKRTREINGACYVNLQCLPDDNISYESYIDVDGESYIVKRLDQIKDENGEYYYDITAYLNFVELGSPGLSIDRFYRTDTVANLLAYILDDTDWTAGDCDIGETLIFKEDKRVSRLQALNDLANQCSGELNWHSKTRVVDLVRQIGTETGLHLRIDKNCKSIKREVDSTNLCTRVIPYGPDNYEINSTIVDACEDETDYTPSGAGNTEASDFKFQGTQAIILNTAALNETFIHDLGVGGVKDLSDHDSLKFAIYSEVDNAAGFTFGIGEAAYSEITVNTGALTAGRWHEVELDLSGVANASKNAIRYIGFKNLTNGAATVIVDKIRAFNGDIYIDSPNIGKYKVPKEYVYQHSAKPEKVEYEIIIYPTDDAEVRQGAPNTNYGSLTYLDSRDANIYDYLSFMKWSFSQIPAGATIVSANLCLNIYFLGVDGSGIGVTSNVHFCDANWNENNITYNNMPAVGDLIGSIDMTSIGEKTFDITDEVDDWWNEVIDNFGIRLFASSMIDNARSAWYSKESLIGKPYIKIIYTLETDPTPVIKADAQKYLYKHDEPKISYKAKMANFSKVMADTWEDETIELGDTLRAYDTELNLNTGIRAFKTIENLLDPSDMDLELGNKAYTMIDIETERAKQLKYAMPYDNNPKIIDANAIQQGYFGGDVG